jgi:hypothetical protein
MKLFLNALYFDNEIASIFCNSGFIENTFSFLLNNKDFICEIGNYQKLVYNNIFLSEKVELFELFIKFLEFISYSGSKVRKRIYSEEDRIYLEKKRREFEDTSDQLIKNEIISFSCKLLHCGKVVITKRNFTNKFKSLFEKCGGISMMMELFFMFSPEIFPISQFIFKSSLKEICCLFILNTYYDLFPQD